MTHRFSVTLSFVPRALRHETQSHRESMRPGALYAKVDSTPTSSIYIYIYIYIYKIYNDDNIYQYIYISIILMIIYNI